MAFFVLGLVAGFVIMFVAPGCKQGPKVTVEVINASEDGADWYNESNGQKGFVPVSGMDKHVCMSPADAQTVFSACTTSTQPSN